MAKDENGTASEKGGDVVESSGKSKDKSRKQNSESESHRRRRSRDSTDSESESEYEDTKRRKSKRKSRKRNRSRRSSDSESESESDYSSESEESERRRRKRKERKRREREEERERKRRKREKEKKRERKEKEKKKKEKGKKGAVTDSWGKYGIIRETDMWNKRPEFTAWLAEVKQVNLESLPNWEEKQMFKQFMEDHNTATFPSKKYYNLDAYYQHKMEKELKKGFKKVIASERTVFNDEEQRRQELMREREKQKEAEVEALKRTMQSGMAQAMKEQAQLREEMAYQYKLGNFEAAAAIQRRLDPDVAMLTYGLDYKGNVCGDRHAHPGLRELELTYWLNPNQVYLSGLKNSQFKLANARSICLLDCPIPSEDGLNWACDYPEGEIRLSVDDWIDRNYDYFEFLTPEMRNTSLQLQGPCYPVIFPSVNVYWRCQYVARASNVSMRHWQQMGGVNINEDIIIDKSIHRSINARSSVLKRYVADIEKSWPVLIVCGGLLPLFVSVIWLLLIRHFVAAMPWITVALFNILIIAVTMFYYLKAGWIGNDAISPIIGAHDPYYHVFGRELNHLRAAAVLMTFIMVVSILTSIAIVHRILMATSVLKVAAKVIGEVQALIIFPVMPYAILGIFYMFWFAAAFYLFSSGQIVQNNCNSNCCAYDLVSKRVNCDRCCGYSIHYTPHISIAIFFHLFGCYWATQFFIACSSTVIAGSVASYYWARGETSPEIPFLPVFSSMKQLIRYSLGSVALGSLVLSFVESVRFILESIRRKLKVANTTPESCMGKTVYHTSRFCFQCIEWIIRSVNRNAYIMIAITGKSFCRASAIATELIISNILRIGRVNVIGDVILYLGKLCVSLSSALFAFLMLDTHKYRSSHNKISSPLLPVLVCWALGYVVATLFFAVVEMSIDAIILSFCQDSEEHQGTAQYAPPLLMETLGDQNEMQRLTQ